MYVAPGRANVSKLQYSMVLDCGKPANGVTDLTQNTKISLIAQHPRPSRYYAE